jgi:predicted nucleic acid-binding Zn ribbon protein
MTALYEFRCAECSRTKDIRGLPPENPTCDFCQARMHRVYSFVLDWPQDKRGH